MCQPAHQEQFGIHYLAQGQFGMQTRGIKPATFQLQDAGFTPLSWDNKLVLLLHEVNFILISSLPHDMKVKSWTCNMNVAWNMT